MRNFELSVRIIALKGLKGIGPKVVADFLGEVFDKTGSYEIDYKFIKRTKIKRLSKLVENGLDEDVWNFECQKARKIIEESEKKGIKTINFTDNEYPKELNVLDTREKPLILFVKGNEKLLYEGKRVAIIGTREPTTFAGKMTQRITEKISEAEFIVVSGLAKGCDCLAHEMASIKNGRTIAILAHGLDLPVYPKENRELANDILRNGGALVSEYPIKTSLRPNYLVERDKWQSGMSSGVIMIESSERGGSRHACNVAIAQNRVLGVLDHTQHIDVQGNPVIATDNTFSLNQKLLKDDSYKVYPLYSLDSVKRFIQELNKKNDDIEKLNLDIKKEKQEKSEKINRLRSDLRRIEQKKLF